ncbi:MAG TPA: M56 family metallopeptidase, partial [Firmicutes bacterium]|nr:M56 family metallopeptidase [Bacillota bacterium]
GVAASPLQAWITWGETIWLLGLVLLLTYSIYTATRLYRQLGSAEPIIGNIHEMRGLKTPFVFGLLRPKIYLPTGLAEKEKSYIIKHEQTHIQRFDHLIKPLAFLVLCVHWFNPLVWLAFFLMSEDMELSCDESVIKQLGSAIKKDYSTSLLALSAGRRQTIGGCPLAFGENNPKGRIINILNYKKPAFWVIAIAIMAVIAVVAGLVANPQKKQFTVEDYARQYMDERIKTYEETIGNWKEIDNFKIVDSKITKLEKMATFDNLLSSPVELWDFEYRLKPNIDLDVMPMGVPTDDGWITETADDMGKPILVVSYEGAKLQYLGHIFWGAFADFSTPANQETALREFLERMELLSPETYSGDHVIVKFPLSTGETCQLFLSQPAVQGEHGIWCVERWMDGNGTVYYETPDTEGLPADYYRGLQKEVGQGHRPGLLDPLQVAIEFIKNGLGQWQVTMGDLVPHYAATVEDFLETPVSHFIGFISNFKNDDRPYFHLDQIEWLTQEDTARLEELGIDPDKEMPNGFYIHNPKSYPMYCGVTEQTQYQVIDLDGDASHKSVTKEEFIEHLEQYMNFMPPFWVTTKDGYVQSITEQYVP